MITTHNMFHAAQLQLTRFARSLRPVKHEWVESVHDGETLRTCTVCGRVEEHDMGGGAMGSIWLPTDEGNRKAHTG